MMDQSRLRAALCNRMLECRQRQLRGHLTGEMPANIATGKRIQNTGQVHKRDSASEYRSDPPPRLDQAFPTPSLQAHWDRPESDAANWWSPSQSVFSDGTARTLLASCAARACD